MRECRPTRADDKPQVLQDENLSHTVAISGNACRLDAVFGRQAKEIPIKND
jgi:hypothetical protein